MIGDSDGAALERGGWRLVLCGEPTLAAGLRDAAVNCALEAAAGHGPGILRRSRRAATYRARLGDGGDFFIKVFDAPRGFERLKRLLSGSRAAHVAAISAALRRAGLNAPAVVIWGRERSSGREIVMTPRADGVMPTRYLRRAPGAASARKRAMLRAIGAEIARLHRAGFVHGDLTPFNIIVDDGDPPRIWFIDHERTRTAGRLAPARARLRNLVQLGRFSFAGLSRADRMRVWSSYAAAMEPRRRRAELRRVLRMLAARIARDGAQATDSGPPIPVHPEVREG
ncbi:MAG TPA: lipopolysaccharide kinase InaA family protein [Candidatus Binataceae bacterium]|nr:lipopolysaccharide kinase InaA family protein [Candidatus Binataceae bacterium]